MLEYTLTPGPAPKIGLVEVTSMEMSLFSYDIWIDEKHLIYLGYSEINIICCCESCIDLNVPQWKSPRGNSALRCLKIHIIIPLNSSRKKC